MSTRDAKIPVVALSLVLVICISLFGCHSPSPREYVDEDPSRHASKADSSLAEDLVPEYDSFSDIPTPYPNLYQHDSGSGWLNTYDESKVISYVDASNYVGQSVTVEGVASSVVYAGSSSGSPHFINMGEGDFAAIIWSQDVARFDQIMLHNYVEWSKSDQPITVTFRVSGTVEMYDGRPQIVARDGSQIATLNDDGTWFTFMSDDSIDALLRQRYQ